MWPLTEPRNHAVSFCVSELGASLCIRFGHRSAHLGQSCCEWDLGARFAAFEVPSRGLVVALDQVTDPRNLGAIIRSAAAFGAQGVVIPARRSASMTAAAWKTSAGAAARIPVAKVTNLNQMLRRASSAGFTVVGLAGEGDTPLSGIPGLDGPVLVVVGSEGEGLARLVRENCDTLVSIPITSTVESLNASVAASIALYEISRQRI